MAILDKEAGLRFWNLRNKKALLKIKLCEKEANCEMSSALMKSFQIDQSYRLDKFGKKGKIHGVSKMQELGGTFFKNLYLVIGFNLAQSTSVLQRNDKKPKLYKSYVYHITLFVTQSGNFVKYFNLIIH